jgi:hypothetical protein
LRRYARDERVALVREAAAFQSWALCERLCEESVRAGAESAAAAVELAELAVEVAMVAEVPVGSEWPESVRVAGAGSLEPAPGRRAPAAGLADAGRWRDRLSGYAWAFVGKARQLAGDPVGAAEALARSLELWPAGAAMEGGALGGLRLLEVAVSLRREGRAGV